MEKVMNMLRGWTGHPSHPPLTDATIGMLSLAAIAAVLHALGVWADDMAVVAYYATVIGLVVAIPTIITGLLDWLQITSGTPLWKTATSHLVAMVVAMFIYLAAAWSMRPGYADGELGTLAIGLAVAAFLVMTLGGWLGGTLVFAHGMRVSGEAEAPATKAVMPDGMEEA